jgi:hypothetical protein
MKFSKYNHEGYPDPTTHEALTNIEKEKRAARIDVMPRSPTFRPIVFICSPYADDPVNNERRAIRYCRFAVRRGFIPIAPHIYFTRFLDEQIPADRQLGLFMGQVMLTKCVELWIFGDQITPGMECEIAKAEERGMPIRYFPEDMEEYGHG